MQTILSKWRTHISLMRQRTYVIGAQFFTSYTNSCYTSETESVINCYRYLPEEEVEENAYADGTNSAYKYEAKIQDIPHHVLVFYSSFYCSGSLITSKSVLTSATCFYQKRSHDKIHVKVGSDYVTGNNGGVIEAEELKIHEFYRRVSEVDNDIALVFLKKHVTFSDSVKKIILVEPNVALRVGTALQTPGYGGTNLQPRYMRKLLLATFFVLGEECPDEIKIMLTSSNYCARYFPEHRLSDNGGGAMFKDILVGILVVGGVKKDPPTVAIFTNVSYFYSWISLNVKEFHKKYCTDYFEISASYYDDEYENQ